MTKEIIISQEGHEAEITEYLFKLSPGQGLILDLGGALSPYILTKHFYLKQETYLSTNVALEIDRVACRIAQTWYEGETGLKYKSILVGDLIAWEVMKWLIAAMKYSVIMERICREFSPRAVVIVDDGSPFARIVTFVAESFGLSVRRLSLASTGNVSRIRNCGSLLRGLAGTLKLAYECFHAGRNTLTNLAAVFGPAFRRSNGLRCVLFDPYVGYELLMPQLFGSGCARIVIPCPNLRLMPRIRYYQNIFGIPTSYFHLPCIRSEATDVNKLQEMLASQLNNLQLPFELPGLEMVWAQLRSALRDYCGLLIQKACIHICSAEIIISRYRVDATVLPYDEFGLYKALALVGRRDGLLTITYQHGVTNRYTVLIRPTSKRVIVWDDDARALLRSWGIEDRRIMLLPNPRIPLLRQRSRLVDRKIVRKKLKVEENRQTAFFAAQPFMGLSALDDPSMINKTLLRIFDLSNLMPNFFFLIKLHPNDAYTGKQERLIRLIEKRGLSNIKVLVLEDTCELILASDVVISGTSTCLWEATVLSRPAVAFVNYGFARRLFPYNSNSGVIRTDTIEELVKVLNDVTGHKESSSVVTSCVFIEDTQMNGGHPGYFNDPRWEVFSLIPPKAKALLDVGCGSGWLGEKIKATRPCLVVGIEKNVEAGKMASRVLDAVFVQDIEKSSLPFRNRSFDCIVVSDLLEHLVDPWETLRRLVDLLQDDGIMIISIPNIGHYTTILRLIAGRFEYEDEGILDRNHLRFFTRKNIKDLLEQSGLRIIKTLRNTHAGRKMRIANFISGNQLADLITFQYIIVAGHRKE